MGETCRFTGSLAHDTGIPATRTEADGEGFEPPRAFALRVFEARAFDQLSQPSMLFSIYPSWYHSPPHQLPRTVQPTADKNLGTAKAHR